MGQNHEITDVLSVVNLFTKTEGPDRSAARGANQNCLASSATPSAIFNISGGFVETLNRGDFQTARFSRRSRRG